MFAALEADEAYLSQAAADYDEDVLRAPEALRSRLLRNMLAEAGREPSRARMLELEKQLRAAKPFVPQARSEEPHRGCKTIRILPLPADFTKDLPKMQKEDLANCLDCDTIVGNPVVSCRKAGDVMRPVNGAGTKSFQKLCQEHGIALGRRERLLLLRDDLGLIWMEDVGCAHRCRLTEQTAHAGKIELV